jgi:hypothetical protein
MHLLEHHTIIVKNEMGVGEDIRTDTRRIRGQLGQRHNHSSGVGYSAPTELRCKLQCLARRQEAENKQTLFNEHNQFPSVKVRLHLRGVAISCA